MNLDFQCLIIPTWTPVILHDLFFFKLQFFISINIICYHYFHDYCYFFIPVSLKWKEI